MDVDNDLDGKLLQQFSSMGTTDREVLIAEFQKLLGNQLNPACCAFFLDMNNWNLQAAICSYYDFEQPNIRVPMMTFIKDVTIGEGESVPPNTKFVKTWRIQNGGEEAWPPGCSLKFCSGDNLSLTDRAMVEPLQPGQMTNVSIDMTSPSTNGVYQGQWRMNTPTGMYFGEVIWVIITVDEGGLLGVTQQLSRFGEDFTRDPSQTTINPFASPDHIHQEEHRPPGTMVQCETPSAESSPTAPSSTVASRWLFQSSMETPSHQTDHVQDTEMS